jgi:CspA family cold shock protein
MSGAKTGTVKFFNEAKGFGFIKETGTGTEYFVHSSGLVDQIKENDEVEFNTKQGKKGINAIDVQISE